VTRLYYDLGPAADMDECTNYDSSCPYNNWAADSGPLLSWSDGNKGGQFGYVDTNGNFVESNTAISHYKASDTYKGVVHITLTVEDGGLYYNDSAVTNFQNVGNLTVWEFTISNGWAGVRPQRDQQRPFTATIFPNFDHKGFSMARIITFRLSGPEGRPSHEPGFCLNATRIQGLWTDTSSMDHDLKFVPGQAGFAISDSANPNGTNFDTAWTLTAFGTATVTVRCLDFGAFGRIDAIADLPDVSAFARLEGTSPQDFKLGAQIPIDENGNFIYDGSPMNNGPAEQDTEDNPHTINPATGLPTLGDGFSRYEEYRSIVYNGAWRENQMDPTVKDVFVYNPNGFDLAVFRTLGMRVHDALGIGEFDFVAMAAQDNDQQGGFDEDQLDGVDNDGDGQTDEDPIESRNPNLNLCSTVINRFRGTASAGAQCPICVLYNPFTVGTDMGQTAGALPGYALCWIAIRNIRRNTNPTHTDAPGDPRDAAVIRMVVAHEMGHAIWLAHHGQGTTRNCVMSVTHNTEL
jgi:hypothetical protein